MKTDDATATQYTACMIAHLGPLVYVYKAPRTRQNRRVRARGRCVHVHTRKRMRDEEVRQSVTRSLTHIPPAGCMRNEASAPFLAPSLPSTLFIRFPPLLSAVEDDGEDPSYDPYPDPPPPFVDDTDETTEPVSNSPRGSIRRREILV